MLKESLKQMWGTYCDTDKLVDDVRALLTKYNHENTEDGVCEMLNAYFTNKEDLIKLFTTSKSYIGNMRICLDVELERQNDSYEVRAFCRDFVKNVSAKDIFLKYVDENGKSLQDYTRVGISKFKAKALHYGDIAERLINNYENKVKFSYQDGATWESLHALDSFAEIVSQFSSNPQPTLRESVAYYLARCKIDASFVGGMKTSRAFNRVCASYGVDKLPNYNKLFAQYSDIVSGLKRKVKFYLSLNPLDYLTMSFGKSWSSCHTIDKENKRCMPDSYRGMHCGGTMSYMLDHTSIITYVHTNATEDHEDGKLYRNMFHFSKGTLVQGRVYPQGNDGATDLYQEFRHIVQHEFSELLELENDEWYKRKCGCGENTRSYGVHYADYLNFDGCNVSYPKEMPEAAEHIVDIGHERICVYCGCEISDDYDSGYLIHANCDDPDDY